MGGCVYVLLEPHKYFVFFIVLCNGAPYRGLPGSDLRFSANGKATNTILNSMYE